LGTAARPDEPVRLVINETSPRAARGPLDIAPARRDFGFAPRVDHREGTAAWWPRPLGEA